MKEILNDFDYLKKDIINRSEFNALMKYENLEFERNFQLKPTAQSSTNEPSTLTSTTARAREGKKESRDDIQVNAFLRKKKQKENTKMMSNKLNSVVDFDSLSRSVYCEKTKENTFYGCNEFSSSIALPNIVS